MDRDFKEMPSEMHDEATVPYMRPAPKQRVRGFEVVADWAREAPEVAIRLPRRKTRSSAGYDFFAARSVTILPGEIQYVPTDVKAYMRPDEVLRISSRSSYGIHRGLVIAQGVATIDADFYGNLSNDGNIGLYLRNMGKQAQRIEIGDSIAQGIFQCYLSADNDPEYLPERTGGIGSTGR